MKRIKNIYTVGHKIHIDEVIDLEKLKTNPALTIEMKNDQSLIEGYRILIKKDYVVSIDYGNPRSLKYAKRALKQLLQAGYLPVGLIEDEPSMKLRGIIEGFYGTPWTHDDRLDVISFLDNEDMNTYIYAPKDDLYHRDKWRLPYPKENFEKLLELIEESQKRDIDFYFSISPGKDFNYTLEEDFIALFKKIDAIIKHGVTHFCLLLDDIDYQLTGDALDQFESPGKAHAYISNRLYQHISEIIPSSTFIMCPTEYWQNYHTPYREDIKDNLDDQILVFWTGYNTIAEFIPNTDGQKVQSYFGHDLVLWDNYPVNDMTTDLIFMGPLENRGTALHHSHVGMVSNPMIEWSLSKIALLTMSDYMWNPAGYDKEQSYQNAVKNFCNNDELVEPFLNVASNFRYSIIHYYPMKDLEQAVKNHDITKIKKYYDELIIDCRKLSELDDKRFIEQLSPWVARIEFDASIVNSMLEKNDSKTKELLNKVENQKHTVGSNIAIKLAKELGIYEGDVYKRHRINFWE